MKLIIDIDDEMYKIIRNSVSVPDMYGDIAINKIFDGIPLNNEDIIKFISDNCRECNEVDREMYEHCEQCGFLKKFLENKGKTTLHSDYGDFELNQPMPQPDNQDQPS